MVQYCNLKSSREEILSSLTQGKSWLHQVMVVLIILILVIILHCRAMVPSLFGTKNCFLGRQFSTDSGLGGRDRWFSLSPRRSSPAVWPGFHNRPCTAAGPWPGDAWCRVYVYQRITLYTLNIYIIFFNHPHNTALKKEVKKVAIMKQGPGAKTYQSIPYMCNF